MRLRVPRGKPTTLSGAHDLGRLGGYAGTAPGHSPMLRHDRESCRRQALGDGKEYCEGVGQMIYYVFLGTR